MTGKRVYHTDDQMVQVAVRAVLRQEIHFPADLKSKAVVAQNNKAHNRGTDAKQVAAKNGLTDRPSLRNLSDKERRRNAPDHPVRPVVDRPVLRERSCPGRIGIRSQADEILEHHTKGLYPVFNNKPRLTSDHEDNHNQDKKQSDADFCQEGNALESVNRGVGVYRAGQDQDNDCDRSS